jgi:hypothetical protein
MKIGRENQSTRRKPAPASLCPPQIPLDQTQDRTRAAVVGYIVLAPDSVDIIVQLKTCFIQTDQHNQEIPGFQQDTVYFTYIIYIKDFHVKRKFEYLNFTIRQFILSSPIDSECCSWVGNIFVSCSGGHVFRSQFRDLLF